MISSLGISYVSVILYMMAYGVLLNEFSKQLK